MKEYKILPAKLELSGAEDGRTVSQSIKGFFFGGGVDGHFDAANAEVLMQKMNEDGWEVVSVAPSPFVSANGEIIITFEREV